MTSTSNASNTNLTPPVNGGFAAGVAATEGGGVSFSTQSDRLSAARAKRAAQQQLVTWVLNQHSKGKTIDDIRGKLAGSGVDADEIETSISVAAEIVAEDANLSRISNISTAEDAADGWLEPEPWIGERSPALPPVECLPAMLRDAVEGIAATVQCTVGLALPSVLAGCASAAGGAYNVRFDYSGHSLIWPLSEYLLTLAPSGERKTSAAKFVDSPLIEFESELFDGMRLRIAQARADAGAWQEKRTGILLAIRQAARAGDDESMRAAEAALREHEANQPSEPLVPSLLIGADFTRERLLKDIATWPVAAGNSAEAGGVLGGYSMSGDQRRGTITTLCGLYDGTNPGQRRAGEGKSEAPGDARLTLSLAMQPSAWQDTQQQHADLISSIGLGPRLLLSEPPSGIGACSYTEPPKCAAGAIKRFQSAMLETLRRSAMPERDQQGGARLELPALTMDAEAGELVYNFMLATESRMRRNGDLAELTGHGRRATEHVCRLAGSMAAVCSRGQAQAVSSEYAQAAIRLVEYFLAEAIRLTGATITPASRDAQRLEEWLVEQGGGADRTMLLTMGRLRSRERLDAAVNVLTSMNRARQIKDGRKWTVSLNPVLVLGCTANLANLANAQHEKPSRLATLATGADAEPTADEINDAFDIAADQVEGGQ